MSSEIKSVLTLDVSKFSIGMEKATANLNALDKQLKSAGAVSKSFEKDVSGLGADVSKASEKFKMLEQSIGNLAVKLNTVASQGFDSVTVKSRQAKQSIEALSGQASKTGESMLSLSEWTKKYGTTLEFIKPSLQNAAKGHQELTKAQEATSKSAQMGAESRIKTNLSMVENELATNKKIIAARQKLASELYQLEQRIRAESMGHKNNADVFSRNVTRNGGQGRIDSEIAQSLRLDNNADEVKKQASAALQLNKAMSEQNALREQKVVGLRAQATAAHRSAQVEETAHNSSVRLANELSAAKTKAFETGAAAQKHAALDAANFERDQANQITQMWKGMGQLWAASKIEKGLGASVNSADRFQRTQTSVNSLNLPKEDVDYITKKAWDDSAVLKFASALDMIKARLAVMGGMPNVSQKHIDDILPQMAKAAHNIQYITGDKSEKGFEDMIRNISGVIEARGQSHNAEASKRTIDLVQKMYLGTGNKIDIADMETYLRRNNLGANTITDEGLAKLVAFLDEAKVSGHGGGGSGSGVSTVGTAVKMFQKMANGGKMTESAVTEFVGAGLMDTSAVAGMNNKQAMKALSQGGLTVADLSSKDPVAALEKIANAAFAYMASPKNVKKYFGDGDVNNEENRRAAMRKFATLTGWSVTAQSMMMTSGDSDKMSRAHASATRIMNAKGANEMNESVMKTYGANVDSFNASLENLKITIGTSLLPVLTPMVKVVSDIVSGFAAFGRSHQTVMTALSIAAALGGVVLAIKGIASVFGVFGSLSSTLMKLANNAGIATESTSKLSAANISGLKSHVDATGGVSRLANAQLSLAQANANSASGMQRLSVIQSQVVPAQRAATLATKEHALATGALEMAQTRASTTSKVLSGGMTMLGGPIGIAILAITALAWAWDAWGNSAEKAALKAEDAANRATRALNGMSDAKDAASNASDIVANKSALSDNEKSIKSAQAELAGGVSGPRALEIQRSIVTLAAERQALLKTASALGDEEVAIKKNIEIKNKIHESEKEALKEAREFVGPMQPEKERAQPAGMTFDSKEKPVRIFEDAFNKTFQDIASRAKSTELKVGSILSDEGSYAQQASALVNGKLLGGQFDDGHDPRNRGFVKKGYEFNVKNGQYTKGGQAVDPEEAIDADGQYLKGKLVKNGTKGAHSLNDMKAQETAVLELTDGLKAVTYAKERASAMDDEASAASKRLHEGLSKESDAYRALSREFERQEARNPAAKAASEDSKSAYSIEKQKALFNRARADMNNYGADAIQSSKSINASLLLNEEGFLKSSLDSIKAQHDATIQAEQSKWDATKSTLDKKLALQDKESALYKKTLSDKELAQKAHDEKMALMRRQSAEASRTPLKVLLDNWGETTGQIQQLNARWMEGFATQLDTLVQTGKVEWQSFFRSMLADIGKMYTRQALSGLKNVLPSFGPSPTPSPAPAADVGAAGAGAAGNAAAEAAAKKVTAAQLESAAALSVGTTARQLDTATTQTGTLTTATKTGVEQVGTVVEKQGTAETVLGTLATKTVETPAEVAFAAAIASFSFALDMMASKMLSVAFSANGNAFGASGLITAFARGGSFSNSVVQTPTAFGFGGNNLGVMGEAGPEAVMPLTRNKNGVLGVSVNGQGDSGNSQAPSQIVSINITVNKNGSEDAKNKGGDDQGAWREVASKIKGVVLQEMTAQLRPGGLLYK